MLGKGSELLNTSSHRSVATFLLHMNIIKIAAEVATNEFLQSIFCEQQKYRGSMDRKKYERVATMCVNVFSFPSCFCSLVSLCGVMSLLMGSFDNTSPHSWLALPLALQNNDFNLAITPGMYVQCSLLVLEKACVMLLFILPLVYDLLENNE